MDIAGPSRAKPKSHGPPASGITAQAEDAKYQAKYRDLKRKVKEVEGDNDKLQFKVLQAKRSIQRMKLERSILYERLSTIPPSPKESLLPVYSGPGIPPMPQQQHQEHRGPPLPPLASHHMMHQQPGDTDDQGTFIDYVRQPRRAAPPMQEQPRPFTNIPEMVGPGGQSHSPHVSRRMSSGHESNSASGGRLPPISALQQYAPPSTSSPHHRHQQQRPEPPRPSYYPPQQQQQQSQPQYSPDLNILSTAAHMVSQQQQQQPRRHDHESNVRGGGGNEDPREREHARMAVSPPPHSRSNQSPRSPPAPSSSRIHGHQRVGPGANLVHPEDRERNDYGSRERGERSSRPHSHRDLPLGLPQNHYLDVSPAGAGGGRTPSRLDGLSAAAEAAQYNNNTTYDRSERRYSRDEHPLPQPPPPPPPLDQPGYGGYRERDPARDYPEQRDSRKRGRNDMDVDRDGGRDDRGSKRFQRRDDSQDEGDEMR